MFTVTAVWCSVVVESEVIYLSMLPTDISLFGFNIFETSGDETQKRDRQTSLPQNHTEVLSR